jgi:hypothetical protein
VAISSGRSIAEIQPQLQPALLRLSAIISQYRIRVAQCVGIVDLNVAMALPTIYNCSLYYQHIGFHGDFPTVVETTFADADAGEVMPLAYGTSRGTFGKETTFLRNASDKLGGA